MSGSRAVIPLSEAIERAREQIEAARYRAGVDHASRQLEQAFRGYRPPAPEFRLPRQTGDLLADVQALQLATLAAVTPAQMDACRLRTEQLTERTERYLEPIARTFREAAAAFVQLGQAAGRMLYRTFPHLVEAARVIEAEQAWEQSSREWALKAKQQRSTGPALPRLDGRKR